MLLNFKEGIINFYKQGRLLSIDFGIKNIGLALCDKSWTVATPLNILPNNRQVFLSIKKLIAQYGFVAIIIGKPVRFNGLEGNLTQDLNSFIKTLQSFTTLNMFFTDEKLTSKIALGAITDHFNHKRLDLQIKKKINTIKVDALAATIMLQFILDYANMKLHMG